MTEAELQHLVAEQCGQLELLHFHVPRSFGMARGWPDSVIIGCRTIFRELKTDAGNLTREQITVGYRLKASGQDWNVWRPNDWATGRITRELESLA